MNKYTHLSDQDRKKAMLPVLAELLSDNAQGMLKDVVKKI